MDAIEQDISIRLQSRNIFITEDIINQKVIAYYLNQSKKKCFLYADIFI